MEILLILALGAVLLVLFGGLLSLQHAAIKPVVDCLSPQPQASDSDEITKLLAEIDAIQERISAREHQRTKDYLPLPRRVIPKTPK